MRILFISSLDDILSPDKPLRNQDQIQFGISYISAVLKKAGHKTSLAICSEISGKKNEDILQSRIEEFRPEIIAFTSVATEYDFILNLAGLIKNKWRDIYLIIGGPHASLNPESVSFDNIFDAVCVGEGEYPLLELADMLGSGIKPKEIRNFWFNDNGSVQRNPARNFIENLDGLPFPDREMWQEWIEEQPGSRLTILLGRGCPFDCTYCCNHALRKIADGKYYRLRSADSIVDELKYLAGKFPKNNEVYMEVETIGIDMKWSIELCEKIREFNLTLDRSLTYGINLRITPNQKLEELFAALQRANFRFINIGLESGSDRVRKEVLKRYYSNDDVLNAVEIARKYGIKVAFFNMIGLPGETYQEFLETVDMNRRCLPDWHYTSIFFPYPGTELHTLCEKMGLLSKKLSNKQERSQAVLDLPGFSRQQIQASYVWFDYLVYKGRRPLGKILYEVAIKKLRSHYYLKNLLNLMVDKIAFFAWLKRKARKKFVGDAYILGDSKRIKEL
jgi:radical SAM superfamily enzyme YgiQ (UPF0313 family)